jgi:peptide methionine sulfoxide reductase msrA/msrB
MQMNVSYFAGGCFWGIEHAYQQVPGVLDARSGYMNGHTASPTYEQVCSGQTGHAEAVQVTFDPARISYGALVWLFWHFHDPTQLNRQGPDIGTQYRSGIYTVDDYQTQIAHQSKEAVQQCFNRPVVTEILPALTFFEAEPYHQDYFVKYETRGSCHPIPDIQQLLQYYERLNENG